MAILIQLDEKLSRMAGGAAETEVAAQTKTVREALLLAARAFPSLHLFNCEGELRGIVRVRRNDAPADLSEPLADSDTLLLHVAAAA